MNLLFEKIQMLRSCAVQNVEEVRAVTGKPVLMVFQPVKHVEYRSTRNKPNHNHVVGWLSVLFPIRNNRSLIPVKKSLIEINDCLFVCIEFSSLTQ